MFEKDGGVFRTSEGARPDRTRFTVEWRGRLDADRREDLILDMGGCGTQECMLGGYVKCADGTYASVFTQYAARVRVKPQKRGWALLRLEHVGELERGKRERSWDTVRFGPDG